MSPATVDTSTSPDSVNYCFQRKGFFAAGRFWAFYSDGTNAGWEFSPDGITWVGAFTSIGTCNTGYRFSVWFDGTYIHYARYNNVNYDLYYRRGTPVNDGTINWSAVEQTVYNGTSTDRYRYPCISVDTSGYAWIGANNDKPDGNDFPVILKNANNDGTWVTEVGFDPYELSAIDSTWWYVAPVPLTGGKVYVVYCLNGGVQYGRLYDAGWGAEENDLADFNISAGHNFSAVAFGDNVHFVYKKNAAPHQIRHNERVWGVGWNAADVLVQDAVTVDCGPALSVESSTGRLYCFWTSTVTDHVYYKRYSGAWGGLVDWIDESADNIQQGDLISSFYMDYGGYIGLLYITKTASPFNVRFAFLTMPRAQLEQVIFGGIDNPLHSTTTEYNSLNAGINWTTTQDDVNKLISTDGYIKNLRVVLDGSPGIGNKYTFTLMLNGAPTALTFDISDLETSGSNMVNAIDVTGGNYVSLQCNPDGGPTARNATWSCVFSGDTGNASLIMGGGKFNLDTAVIKYSQLMCSDEFFWTEFDIRQVIPTAGTIKNFYVKLSGSPGTAPDAYKFTLRKGNGVMADTLLTVTITAPATIGSDLINTVAVVAGEIVTLKIEPLNTPSARKVCWGMTFLADVDGESIVLGGTYHDFHATDTLYNTISGYAFTDWNADETLRYQLGQVCTVKKLYVEVEGAPGVGKSYTIRIRIAGADSNVVATITGATNKGNSGALEDTVALDEYVNLSGGPTNDPPLRRSRWGFVIVRQPQPTSKISGVTDPAEVAGVAAANIAKLKGVIFVP